jgi:hypothetical protein
MARHDGLGRRYAFFNTMLEAVCDRCQRRALRCPNVAVHASSISGWYVGYAPTDAVGECKASTFATMAIFLAAVAIMPDAHSIARVLLCKVVFHRVQHRSTCVSTPECRRLSAARYVCESESESSASHYHMSRRF